MPRGRWPTLMVRTTSHLVVSMIETVLLFAFLRWGVAWSLQRWGDKWGFHEITDMAVIPLVLLLASIFSFVSTPIDNTFTRAQEYEADMYGLNTSRQPDGFAQGAIHLGEYRKMSPSPVEEWIFYDHPSGRNRIYASMRWKEENLSLFSAQQNTSGAPPAAADKK